MTNTMSSRLVFTRRQCKHSLEYLKVSGEEILYIGDHIYGDILRLKKGLQIGEQVLWWELTDEVSALKSKTSK